jgi:hypothetical protein
LALKFVNTNNSGSTIRFISSQDFAIGSPIYYKQIGFGNYTLAGTSGNKTATIISASGISGLTTRNLYFNFSDINVPSNNYMSTISSSGLNISVPSINTSSVASGTVNFYDYELGNGNLGESFAQYIISKKQSATPNSYTAIKVGELNLSLSNWNSLKDYSESYSGLVPGQNYYLSSNNSGKIVNFTTSIKLFTAVSRTKAFINLMFSDDKIQTNQSIIRETFTGTGSQNIYTLAQIPTSIDTTTVFINGLFQIPGDAFTLNNNVVTFSGFPPLNSKVTIQYLKQYVFTGYDLYSTRKEYSLTINSEISLLSLFLTQDSAQYRFFDISNPTISGTISLKNNGLNEPLVRVDTNSDDVTIMQNSNNKLNVYLKLDNLVYFQNKTLNTVNLRIYKEI